MAIQPLNEEEQKHASAAVRDLRVALSNFFLYAPENTMVQQSLDRFLQDLAAILASRPQVTLGQSEGLLVVEGTPVDTKFTGSTAAITDLFLQHQLHSLTFLQGLERAELVHLFQLLKPKSLPAGESLTDALKRVSTPHIQVNQKVFVAVKEGEKLIATEDLGGEENVAEAMQSLQAFLAVFAKVKPDGKKREILGTLRTQLGPIEAWGGAGSGVVSTGGGTGAGSGRGEGSGEGPGGGWGELIAGLLSLKNMLQNVQTTPDPKKSRESIDDLLQKMVALLENQGLADASVRKALGGDSGPEEEQESLFEKETALREWKRGEFGSLTDPERAQDVEEGFRELLLKPDPSLAGAVWDRLDEAVAEARGERVCLLFRHLSRMPREALTPDRQERIPALMRRSISSADTPEALKAVLDCAGKWSPREIRGSNLAEFAGLLDGIRAIANSEDPADRERASLAGDWLASAMDPERVQAVLEAAFVADEAVEPAFRILSTVEPAAVMPILDRLIALAPSDPAWRRGLDLLFRLQADGREILEKWSLEHEPFQPDEAFLRILDRVPLSPAMAPVVERAWPALDPETKKRILDLAARWETRAFRGLALEALLDPDLGMARHALKILPKIHLEGDSLRVVESVEKRSHPGKEEKEMFMVVVCKALGQMAEPMSLTALMDWGQSHGLLERHRTKSLPVRMAAVEAMGNFRSRQVETYLEKMVEKEEKDLLDVARESLASVKERLAKGMGADRTADRDGFDPSFPKPAGPEEPPAHPDLLEDP